MNTPYNPAVSIIIAAYTEERWENLLAAVESVERQTIAPLEVILVIDHNPALLERARQQFTACQVIENSRGQGVAGARNSGVLAARGEIIVFLDDDAIAYPDWLEQMVAGYAEDRVMGVGGTIEPLWEAGRPRWFPGEFNWVVGCTYRGLPHRASPVRNLIGASMSFRREVFSSAGFFQEELGRVGKRALGCEETELSIKIRQRWPEAILLYKPESRVRHLVTSQRGSWSYLRRRCYNEGISKALVSRSVGVKDGLDSEWKYTLKVLPTGVLKGLWDVISRADLGGVGRAVAIITGLVYTVAGYLVGSARTGRAARQARRQPTVREVAYTMFMLSALIAITQLVEDVNSYLPPVITVSLIAVLAGRELLNGLARNRLRLLDRVLRIVSVPLLVAFVVTVALRISESIGNY